MRIHNCCREIRTEALCSILERGSVLEGFNTITGKLDKVIVIRVHKDNNDTVVVPYSDKTMKKIKKLKKRLGE